MKKTFQAKRTQTILLLLVLALSAFLRLRGLDWDDDYHLHPDERFLTWVETSITPVATLRQYFDTANSTLNPHNVGHTFYVYGTFPLFLVRFVAEGVEMTAYSEVYLVGRVLSAIFDVGIVLLLYFMAQRLFAKPALSLLAALFYGLSTLPIQQSHFFTVDTFANFFMTLAIFLAICIFQLDKKADEQRNGFLQQKDQRLHLLFGLVVGLAAACKINAVITALFLPVAVILRDGKAFREFDKEFGKRVLWFVLAGILFLFVFRICQPYAFQGPGFFGLRPNARWLDNLRELTVLSSGNTNYPPSLQWARRPLWFAWQNLLQWGMGLPIGILALLSVVIMGWKMLHGEWRPYLLIWLWIVLYGGWQSMLWNPTMRYLLFIYPTLAIGAAWMLITILHALRGWRRWLRVSLSVLLLLVVLASSLTWAFAFSEIYTRPVTRVAATEWIYKNVEGPINLQIEGETGAFTQPLSYPHTFDLTSDNSLRFAFSVQEDMTLQSLHIEKIQNYSEEWDDVHLNIHVSQTLSTAEEILFSTQSALQNWDDYGQVLDHSILVEPTILLKAGQEYWMEVGLAGSAEHVRMLGYITADGITYNGGITQTIYETAPSLSAQGFYDVEFTPYESGTLEGVTFFRIKDWYAVDSLQDITVSVRTVDEPNTILTQGVLRIDDSTLQDFRGNSAQISFAEPIALQEDKRYKLTLQLSDGDGYVALYGSKRLNETTWDDGLPLYMFGVNPFDPYTGVFHSDLNLDLYWEDNESKLERFYTSLEQTDYIYITSNRQWGSTTQIPERYPLTSAYYQALLGCPSTVDIQDCYRDAQPGMFQGELGFELVQVFQSEPQIGSWTINTQYAEEAFTVYDHPKVLIFEKSDDFSMQKVRGILGAVDLSKVINLTPAEANRLPGDLTLTTEQSEAQTEGGTWSYLFSYDDLINRYQGVGLLVWYLVLFLLGLVVYPTTRLIFGGLADRGYPFSRLLGLLLLAWLTWWSGSLSIPVERWLISVVFLVILLANLYLFLKDREEILAEIKGQWKHILQVELLFLGFFLFFTLIRLGNPDLWHQYKGGEKPMDFAYFNAVIKSSVFPPYDPWYAGGYINYYYFGSVLLGVFTKWLGVVPSIAYNFGLITFFAFSGIAAYAVGWNIHTKRSSKSDAHKPTISAFQAGLITAFAVLIIGNLGTITMFLNGLELLAPSTGMGSANGFLSKPILWVRGFVEVFKGAIFRYYPGDWYWIPSRTIPGEAITEFPYFTFLYGDPHAHLFAFPLTLLGLGYFAALIFSDERKETWCWLVKIIGGGVLVGALAPTNTWDYPLYLLFGVLGIAYEHLKRGRIYAGILPHLKPAPRKWVSLGLSLIFFIASSYLCYAPYHAAYGAGYTSVQIWEGSRSPLRSFVIHWGIFFFFLLSWLVLKTRDWLAKTPISFIKKIKTHSGLVWLVGLLVVAVMIWLIISNVQFALVTIPVLIWALLLFVDTQDRIVDRFILLLTMAGVAMIFMVEMIVLTGDIGRMNTVFKFYLQAWTLLAVSAAYGGICVWQRLARSGWSGWKKVWRAVGIALMAFGLMFPLAASMDKIRDRISDQVPLTLDGMDYMQTATYWQNDSLMDLEQDYRAIRWMQEHVSGSPVIVEGNVSLYQWGNRYSIYTGLPAVVGWDWHQRQQKQILPSNFVSDRITDVNDFYSTVDIRSALEFLAKYDVRYIFVGQLERIVYNAEGMQKFTEYEGVYWTTVFAYEDTVILEVKE